MSKQSAFLTMLLRQNSELTLRELKRGATDMPGANPTFYLALTPFLCAMFNDNCSLANS